MEKDKPGKKKGPLKKLSKCLTFWKNKQAGKGSEKEASSKEVRSESTVTNASQSDLTPAMVEKDLPTPNVSTHSERAKPNVSSHSESHSRSHFHIACESDDVKELTNSKGEMPNVSESTKTSQNSASKYSEDTTMQPQESHIANHYDSKNTVNKLNRFTVTAVSEEAAGQNKVINRTTSNELKDGVKHMSKENEQNKALVCESRSNSADHANELQKPEIQISQSRLDSDKFMDIKKNYKSDTPQHKLDAVVCKNEDKAPSENHSCQPSLYVNKNINFIDKQLSELQDQQLGVIPQTCAKQADEYAAPRNVELIHSLKNDINDYSVQSKIHHSSPSSDNSNNPDNGIKLNVLKPSYNSDNYRNDTGKSHPQIEVCQSDVSLANYTSNVDKQHALISVDQINIDEKLPESKICQNNLNSSSSSNIYAVQHSETPTFKPCSDSSGHITGLASEEGKSEIYNNVKNAESQAWKENLKTDNFNINNSKTRILTSEKENAGINNSEIRDASTVGAHDIMESLHGLPASGLSNHSSSSSLDQMNLDQYRETIDDEDSNIASEDEPPELTFVSQIENEKDQIYNQFSFISHSNDNSQVLSECKDDNVPFHSMDKNDDPSHVSEYNDEVFRKKNIGQTVENCPSMNLSKEMSERGTKSYLPYLTSLKESENRRALSDLTTNGNSHVIVDNNSTEVHKQEKQSPEPRGEFAKKDDIASIQRTPSSANSVKHSRLPVRKSLGSENIVDRISKLSNELEELRTDIKQKSDNRSRSNTSTPSRSKIPRKYVSSSAMLHSK